MNVEEGVTAPEASGYTPAPTTLRYCWGGRSPRRRRASTRGDKSILRSQATQIHRAEPVTSFPS